MHPSRVPEATFHTRERSTSAEGRISYDWRAVTTDEIFAGRSVVLFALPGAFTPACSETHLPGFERHHAEFAALGVDEICCLAVNDAFVMNQWGRYLNIDKVRMLPDGNGDFSRGMGMLVSRAAQGMGMRSWRYAMHVVDGEIRILLSEPGLRDDPPGVPVTVSDAESLLERMRAG